MTDYTFHIGRLYICVTKEYATWAGKNRLIAVHITIGVI